MAGFQTTMQSARKNITDLQAQLAKGDADPIQAELDQLRRSSDLKQTEWCTIGSKGAKGMRSTGEKDWKAQRKN